MFGMDRSGTCRLICWGLGALIGLGAFLVFLKFTYTLIALLVGALIGVGAAVLLRKHVCEAEETHASEAAGLSRNDAAQSDQTEAEPLPRQSGGNASTASEQAEAAIGAEAAPPPPEDQHVADQVDKPSHVAEDEATAQETTQAFKLTPSKELPGQAELSSRKGAWRYEPPAAPQTEQVEASETPETAKTASENDEAPQRLDQPNEGGADDLKKIKGIGPKLEKLCNEMGFYHYAQIAAWSDAEVAWVNKNLAGFKGRVSRDDWVAQAKLLSEGGETEFSRRVDKGGVY